MWGDRDLAERRQSSQGGRRRRREGDGTEIKKRRFCRAKWLAGRHEAEGTRELSIPRSADEACGETATRSGQICTRAVCPVWKLQMFPRAGEKGEVREDQEQVLGTKGAP